MRELCYKARELLIEEGNVVRVDAPVTVRTIIAIDREIADENAVTDMRRHPWPIS